MANIFDWKTLGINLNIHEMDEGHKLLVGKMNNLYESKLSGDKYNVLSEKLTSLENAILEHFKNEESYMAKISFPDIKDHIDAHEHLLKKFREFRDEFESKQKLSDQIFTFLKGWISSHILHLDRRYADYINLTK